MLLAILKRYDLSYKSLIIFATELVSLLYAVVKLDEFIGFSTS